MTGRRARGEGSISRRVDGRYVARVELGVGPKGQRRRKEVYGASKAEVVQKLRELIRQREEGGLSPGKTPTVGSFLLQWLEASRPSLSYNTWQRYEGLTRGHLIPGLGRLRLDRLSPGDVEVFTAGRLKQGLSPRSVHHLRAVLRTALNRGIRWGMVQRNAAQLAEPVRTEHYDYRVLDPDGARRFLDSVAGDRLEGLWTVALALGLRQGEELGLCWPDVDFQAATLTIHHSLQWRKADPAKPAQPVLAEPKTERSRRTLILPAAVLRALREHRSRQLQERLLAGSRWQASELVFTNPWGRPLAAGYVLQLFRRALAEAELPQMRFHELRHSAASLLIAQGVPLKVVSDLLGHSSIALTANTYGHVLEASRREAAEAMDRALGRREEMGGGPGGHLRP